MGKIFISIGALDKNGNDIWCVDVVDLSIQERTYLQNMLINKGCVLVRKSNNILCFDVTNLSANELGDLKAELIGRCNIYGIDRIIEKRFCTSTYYNRNARDNRLMSRRRIKHNGGEKYGKF